MDPAGTGNCPGAVAARLGKGCQVRIRAVVPGGKALRRNVGSQTAVQHRRFALGAPRPPQIDAARRAVGDEIAVPENKSQPVGFPRGGRDIAVGDVVVHRAEGALLKQGIRPAKDEINVPRDLAFVVILGTGPAGGQPPGAEEAVFLPLFFRQRGAEEGILVAQQLHPAEHRPGAVHIGRHSLPHLCPGARIVFNGQVFHREIFAAEKRGVAAERMGRPAVRVGQLAAVSPHDAGLVGPGPPEGDVLFFADQLFPVNARADLNFGLAFIGHRQHCLRDGGKVPGAIPLYCDLQHAFRPPDG